MCADYPTRYQAALRFAIVFFGPLLLQFGALLIPLQVPQSGFTNNLTFLLCFVPYITLTAGYVKKNNKIGFIIILWISTIFNCFCVIFIFVIYIFTYFLLFLFLLFFFIFIFIFFFFLFLFSFSFFFFFLCFIFLFFSFFFLNLSPILFDIVIVHTVKLYWIFRKVYV